MYERYCCHIGRWSRPNNRRSWSICSGCIESCIRANIRETGSPGMSLGRRKLSVIDAQKATT
jgi:hypothetical protein